jgi:hypothetical protein
MADDSKSLTCGQRSGLTIKFERTLPSCSCLISSHVATENCIDGSLYCFVSSIHRVHMNNEVSKVPGK